MSLWLSEEELVELTGYKQQDKQKVALAELGYEFRSRPSDGFPLVKRCLFETLTTHTKRREPRLHLIGRA